MQTAAPPLGPPRPQEPVTPSARANPKRKMGRISRSGKSSEACGEGLVEVKVGHNGEREKPACRTRRGNRRSGEDREEEHEAARGLATACAPRAPESANPQGSRTRPSDGATRRVREPEDAGGVGEVGLGGVGLQRHGGERAKRT